VRIGLDIDSVVADIWGHIIAIYPRWFGEECPIEMIEWDDFNKSPHFPDWPHVQRWADKARVWETMPLMPGAAAGIDTLLTQGHQLSFLTARSGVECVEQTRYWFQREISAPFGLAMDRLYTGLRGSKATIPCSIYVDDGPVELAALKAAGKSTIRFKHPWNKGVRATAHVNNWKELTSLIGDLES
jgi:5'(3')-deoxyribonucleotidase